MPEEPTDINGDPICARPCQDGQPCYRNVPSEGDACYLHADEQSALPLPDEIPDFDRRATRDDLHTN